MEDKWISTDEAAEYLGVKATTIREWIKRNNGIPAHKIGRLWKFKKNELDKWIKSGKSATIDQEVLIWLIWVKFLRGKLLPNI